MDEELIKKAFAAIKNDDLNTLRQLEQQHKTILHLQDPFGMTMVHEACKYDKDQIVSFLARRQVAFHLRNHAELGGNNPLMLACALNHMKVITVLLAVLQRRPDAFSIDDCNNVGDTALMIAAREGRTVIMKMLLKSGARVHIVNGDGRNAALIAAEHRHYNAVQILVECGVDPDFQPAHGHTLTYKAKKDANLEEALVKAARHRNLVSSGLHVYADKSAAASIQQLSKEDTLDFESRRQHCETKRQQLASTASQESKTKDKISSSSSSSTTPATSTPTSPQLGVVSASAVTSPPTATTTTTSGGRLASPSTSSTSGLLALFHRMRAPSDNPHGGGGGGSGGGGSGHHSTEDKRPTSPLKGREGSGGGGGHSGETMPLLSPSGSPHGSPRRSPARPRSNTGNAASISISLSYSSASASGSSSTSSISSPSSSISISSSSQSSSHSHTSDVSNSPESTVVSLSQSSH